MSDKKTVLIVDDTPENLDILDEILKDKYNIKAAPNGKVALKIASAPEQPNIILLDIMMPDMDGYEVCKKLKKDNRTKDIPVIFITAKEEIDDKLDGYDVGAVHYLTKPVDPDYVLDAVEKYIK